MGVTDKVASFVAAASFQDLPKDVVDKVKNVILDSIGCALGGIVTDRAKIALKVIGELGGSPQATIIGGPKSSVALASFANSELINAMDFDPIGPLTGHVVPYSMPTCLSLAEYSGASGKELITGVALGLEIGGRLAGSLGHLRLPKKEYPFFEWAENFSYSPTIFGGVAGGANLMKLTSSQIKNALGIAGLSTPVPGGTRFENSKPNMTKYDCWSGHISNLATMAVMFARNGFTSDTSIFDGEHAFWKLYGAPFFKENVILDGLGTRWSFDAIEFKPYPACRCNHSTIDAIRQMMKENKLAPGDVQAITCKADPLLLESLRLGETVESYADTQFCNRYIFAVACFSQFFKPGPSWQMPITYNNELIKKLMKRVTVEEHPAVAEQLKSKFKTGTYSSFRGALVEVKAKGKKFAKEIPIPFGSTGNPMTREAMCDKFMTNASYSRLDVARAEKAIQMLLNLEKVKNVQELLGQLGI